MKETPRYTTLICLKSGFPVQKHFQVMLIQSKRMVTWSFTNDQINKHLKSTRSSVKIRKATTTEANTEVSDCNYKPTKAYNTDTATERDSKTEMQMDCQECLSMHQEKRRGMLRELMINIAVS